jgi:carboxypeptidase family protein
MADSPSRVSQLLWIYISGAAFVLMLLGMVAYIAYAGQLTFIPNWLYYVLLLPGGLAAAAFLHGAMRSHAKFTGKMSYGTVQLAGPSVVAALFVVGGFLFANRATTFALTVRTHGPDGPSDIIRTGTVTLDLGQDRRTAPIGQDGRVVFAEVPASLSGESVRLIPDVQGYAAKSDEPVAIPAGHVLDLALVRKTYATPVSGTVTDAKQRLVPGALVSFNGGMASATTDASGRFALTLPLPPGTVVPVIVSINGRIVYDSNVTVAEQPALRLLVKS